MLVNVVVVGGSRVRPEPVTARDSCKTASPRQASTPFTAELRNGRIRPGNRGNLTPPGEWRTLARRLTCHPGLDETVGRKLRVVDPAGRSLLHQHAPHLLNGTFGACDLVLELLSLGTHIAEQRQLVRGR